jgi:hypothetical protein
MIPNENLTETKEEAQARIKARFAELNAKERDIRAERLALKDEWEALNV